jgi:hypothetical protein
MPIWWGIVLMVVGILGVALMIYSMTLMPPQSIVLLVVAFIIILATTLPMIAIMVAEAPKQSSGEIIISQTPTTTSMPPACYWVWTDKAHDPTDKWGKLLLVGEPVVGCEQPGWNVSEENIPPYCWCP